MLDRLSIRDFALIGQLELEFPAGFTAITGETGAGKSMLLAAVAACLGERVSRDALREGTQGGTGSGARVACVFTTPQGECRVERDLRDDGRSRYLLNGEASNQKQVKALAPTLLDLHSQRDQTRLLDAVQHAALLDSLPAVEPVRARHTHCWQAWETARDAHATLLRQRERDRELRDLWTYQLEELDTLAARPGEDVALAEEQSALSHVEEVKQGAWQSADSLWENEDNIHARLAEIVTQLRQLARWDKRLQPSIAQLDECLVLIEEAGRSLADHAESVELDPERLAVVRERLAVMDKLIRKYGGSLDALLAEQERLSHRLSEQGDPEQRLQEAEQALTRAGRDLDAAAAGLSEARTAGADWLCTRINPLLFELGIEGRGLSVVMEPAAEHDPLGAERPRFLAATNPDSQPAPLEEIASGGELSRIMLALRTVLSEHHEGHCLLFDEIDTGISGRAALAVARRIRELATRHQVICITHLPQIAAAAEHHLGVEKEWDGQRTRITARWLDENGRLDHIAQLQSGHTGPPERAAARRLREQLQSTSKSPQIL
ncbi:MAG: DNA repair protein RecN [Calditrichaeota bacterium]|nr:DNA repair protein RecN [Calditrichota bacterium]